MSRRKPEVTETDPPEAADDPIPQGLGGPGPFPAAFLLAGDRARRACWAPGFELVATAAGGRSGARLTLMITGARSGLVEWKPPHPADELLAQDWLVVPAAARDPLP